MVKFVAPVVVGGLVFGTLVSVANSSSGQPFPHSETDLRKIAVFRPPEKPHLFKSLKYGYPGRNWNEFPPLHVGDSCNSTHVDADVPEIRIDSHVSMLGVKVLHSFPESSKFLLGPEIAKTRFIGFCVASFFKRNSRVFCLKIA